MNTFGFYIRERPLAPYSAVEITSPGLDHDFCACSADGSFVVWVESGGRVWTSIDYGDNFTERRPIGDVASG